MATAVTRPATESDTHMLYNQEAVKFPFALGAYYNTRKYGPREDVGQPQDGTQSSQVNLAAPHQYKKQVLPDAQPTRVEAEGYILPTGYYQWDGRIGIVPNPTLAMPGFTSPVAVQDSGYIGPFNNVLSSIDPTHALRTTSITNNEFGILSAVGAQVRNELRAEPDRWKESMRAAQEAKTSSQSNQTANSAEANQNAGWDAMDPRYVPLINVANENAWIPCDPEAPFKSYANAAWMVGQMYKQVYIPMAILLLLPGAVLTQVKIIVRTGLISDPSGYDDDLFSPFSGILRSLIAVFLIPATQLFVSYTIDVGNSLTYEVVNYRLFDLNIIKEWRDEQTYQMDANQNANHIENIPDSAVQGKSFSDPEKQVTWEHQNFLTSTGQHWFNTIDNLLSQGMLCLTAFQVVMIMYLFLLGPVAAALYAWPGVGGDVSRGGDVFRKAYANWMDGVVLVTLWKFWWVVVLLCMSIRLQVFQDLGDGVPRESTFEQFMLAAFTAILMYVPFNPFDFRPGDLVDSVLQQAQSQTSKGGSGAAVVGAAGGAGGSGGQGGTAGGGNSPSG
jgi:hypothetical protein